MGFKSTDFLDDRALIDAGFNQGDHLTKEKAGICDVLCMYWLKRCSKMNYSGALPQPTSSVFGRKIWHKSSELQEELKARMKGNFEKIETFRASLNTEQFRSTDEKAKKAVRAHAQATAKLASQGDAPPRGSPPGVAGNASLASLTGYLERRADRALDARDASFDQYGKTVAAKYGLTVHESIEGKDSLPGDGAASFILKHPLVTISFYWDNEDFGHRMAAYRANAFNDWGFVFFDPNRGSYLCERADGVRFLNEWAAAYGGISAWKVTSWHHN